MIKFIPMLIIFIWSGIFWFSLEGLLQARSAADILRGLAWLSAAAIVVIFCSMRVVS